jgi:hypothetical protein
VYRGRLLWLRLLGSLAVTAERNDLFGQRGYTLRAGHDFG